MKPVQKSPENNRFKEKHFSLKPNPQILANYFEYPVSEFKYLKDQGEPSEFLPSLRMKRLMDNVPINFLSATLTPELDLIIPQSEFHRLKNQFTHLMTEHFDRCVSELMERQQAKNEERQNYMKWLLDIFVSEYVAIRSIIRIDA